MTNDTGFHDCLQSCRLPEWQMLPDFGLYMDQMVTYIEKLFGALDESLCVTPSMINNYVKAGLIDRAQGKKYTRESLAQLLMICELKQTASMEDMNHMLHHSGVSTQQIYEEFCATQDRIIGDFSDDAMYTPLSCALQASSYRLLSRYLLKQEKATADTQA